MPRIQIAELSHGSNVTRADGAVLRTAIEQLWNDAEPVILDFQALRIASVSFFDEGVGVLAKAYGREVIAKRLRVENIDPSDRKLLNEIVSSRAREREHATSGDSLKQLLREAGIAEDILSRWDGTLLALYQNHGAVSASLEVAQRLARENAERGDWVLDLGHYATALSREVGQLLKEKFDRLGVTYQTRSLTDEWQRDQRPATAP
jgi:STAS-like domain of unknown function (DUF4325)